jgi:hypothetical protein
VVCSAEMDGKNKLYFGDNLNILRDHVADASVTLTYLDPPFNSNATGCLSVAALYERRPLHEEKPAVIDRRYSKQQRAGGANRGFEDARQWSREAEAVLTEAAATGFYESKDFPGRYPRLQILTVAELLARKKLEYPTHRVETLAKAKRKTKTAQEELF